MPPVQLVRLVRARHSDGAACPACACGMRRACTACCRVLPRAVAPPPHACDHTRTQDAKPKYNQGVATSTAIINYNASPNDPHRPTSMPIYQSSTFIQPAADEFQVREDAP